MVEWYVSTTVSSKKTPRGTGSLHHILLKVFCVTWKHAPLSVWVSKIVHLSIVMASVVKFEPLRVNWVRGSKVGTIRPKTWNKSYNFPENLNNHLYFFIFTKIQRKPFIFKIQIWISKVCLKLRGILFLESTRKLSIKQSHFIKEQCMSIVLSFSPDSCSRCWGEAGWISGGWTKRRSCQRREGGRWGFWDYEIYVRNLIL